MCGIVGHISTKGNCKIEELKQACDVLHHRGPDGNGQNMIVDNKVGFGHTRLSFLDLSEQGQQPMYNGSKNVCITFNGEIYNYLELKEILSKDYSFTTNTDTEVILAAYEKWGMEMMNKLEGMFAFGLYDLGKEVLYLARDRFGIKPLYYYHTMEDVIFASELKAINTFSAFDKNLDWSSFSDYFVYRYIPSPKTIWANTYKVEPGHFISFQFSDILTPEHKEYWKPSFADRKVSAPDLIEDIGNKLEQSVTRHARADVPIGSFLSGGYDSSAIVAMLKNAGLNPATFSIGFRNWDKSEDQYADIVAKHLSVSNKKTVVDDRSLNFIDKMPMVYDEPIADISIIPTYLVSQLAAKDVKAVMSGEGADEAFGGYHWQKTFYEQNNPSSFVQKIKQFFQPEDTLQYYAEAMSMGWFDEKELKLMLNDRLHKHIPEDVHWFYKAHLKPELSPLKRIQYMDMKCFMGELVLTKVDRASMAHSLEVRVPFLQSDIIETIFQTNEHCYYKKDVTKFVLFENIKERLPNSILQREKQGFVGPDSYYMNKAWYKEQLKNSNLVADKVINQSYIDSLLATDYDWRIWKILVMEKWYAHWMK